MSFGKSLFIALSATGTTMGAVAIAGLLTNSGPLAIGPDAERRPPPIAPEDQRTVVMEPVPLDPRGYTLTGSEQDDLIYVSVEMVTHRKDDRQLVCKLMPRLKAAILTDLGPRLRALSSLADIDEIATNQFIRARFDHALGAHVVAAAKVSFLQNRRQGRSPNCTAAMHGAWQTWLRSGPLSKR